MTAMTADQIASLWVQRMQGAQTKAQAGAEAVTVAPGQAAARQVDVWAANTAASKAKYAKNVAAVTAQQWASAYVTKGIPRMGTGATAAESKVASVMAKLIPAINQARQSLPPRGTYEQNKQRALSMMDKLHAQAGQFKA